MNKKLIDKMLKATEEQAEKIKKFPCWEETNKKFQQEYALAVEMHKAREAAKLSQKEIANRMHTTQSVVSRIESGANVSVSTLARYAEAIGKRLEIHLV